MGINDKSRRSNGSSFIHPWVPVGKKKWREFGNELHHVRGFPGPLEWRAMTKNGGGWEDQEYGRNNNGFAKNKTTNHGQGELICLLNDLRYDWNYYGTNFLARSGIYWIKKCNYFNRPKTGRNSQITHTWLVQILPLFLLRISSFLKRYFRSNVSSFPRWHGYTSHRGQLKRGQKL